VCPGGAVGLQLLLPEAPAVEPLQTPDDHHAAGRLLQRPQVHHRVRLPRRDRRFASGASGERARNKVDLSPRSSTADDFSLDAVRLESEFLATKAETRRLYLQERIPLTRSYEIAKECLSSASKSQYNL